MDLCISNAGGRVEREVNSLRSDTDTNLVILKRFLCEGPPGMYQPEIHPRGSSAITPIRGGGATLTTD